MQSPKTPMCITGQAKFKGRRGAPEILTRSVLAFGCAPRAASGFSLDFRKPAL